MEGPGQIIFITSIFIISLLYSSVGHGGASGYLALMAVFNFDPAEMKASALILNAIVSSISFYQFHRGGHFQWKLLYPFIITSVPFTFIGSYIEVDPFIYKKILGVLLLLPVIKFLLPSNNIWTGSKELEIKLALPIGASIGLLSGMIGIGGGIILSPIIILMHWANMKQTAAVSALFIFINSLTGLGAVYIKGAIPGNNMYLWGIVVIAGAFAGSLIAQKKLTNKGISMALSIILLIGSMKLLIL